MEKILYSPESGSYTVYLCLDGFYVKVFWQNEWYGSSANELRFQHDQTFVLMFSKISLYKKSAYKYLSLNQKFFLYSNVIDYLVIMFII